MKNFILIMTGAVALSASCERLLTPEASSNTVQVRVSAGPAVTKGLASPAESAVHDLNVWAYLDGQLDAFDYASGAECCLRLLEGADYHVYALANMGKKDAPFLEAELPEMVWNGSGAGVTAAGGIAMASAAPAAFVPRAGGTLHLQLTRLLSKFSLRFDSETEYCSWHIDAARVMQEAASVRPFRSSCAGTSFADGMSASAEELQALNAGESISFYAMENCRGVLLPGNSDPLLKRAESLDPATAASCTYLHLEGVWETPGASGKLGINLYLGKDNCTDFSVERNVSTSIELTLTDEGTLLSNWKVDMDDFDDNRSFAFGSPLNVVMQEDGWTEIPLTVNPPQMPYFCSCSDGSVAQCRVENGKLYARAVYDGYEYPLAKIYVWSWDGRQRDSSQVFIDYVPDPFTEYSATLPEYFLQYGKISFPTASAEVPVRFIVNGHQWKIGADCSESLYTYENTSTGVTYSYVPHTKTVWVTGEHPEAYDEILIRRKREKAVITVPATKIPSLSLDHVFITQVSNEHYGESFDNWYSAAGCVKLCHGSTVLPAGMFAIPSEVLLNSNIPDTPATRYSRLKKMYLDGMSFSVDPDCGYYVEKLSDSPSAATADWIAKIYFYCRNEPGVLPSVCNWSAESEFSLGRFINGSATIQILDKYPDWRYLGSTDNWQLAAGSQKSENIFLNYYSTPGRTPVLDGSSVSFRHTPAASSESAYGAYSEGTEDDYSSALYLDRGTIKARPVTSDRYPACGRIAMRLAGTNPYTGNIYAGYYFFDLVLQTPVGMECEIQAKYNPDVPTDILYSVVPFSEYVLHSNAAWWNAHFPQGVRVLTEKDHRDVQIYVPTKSMYGPILRSGVYPTDYPGLINHLAGNRTDMNFSFYAGGVASSSLRLDAAGFAAVPELSSYSDGSSGFYNLYRQYDAGTVPPNGNYGVENYLIEAAFGHPDIR